MAESSDNVELGVKQDDVESESPCCSQATDDVFVVDDEKPRREPTEADREHASRSRERRHSRRSEHRSRSHNPGHGNVTKTELIRASAKRAERERHRNHSGDMKHRHKNKLSTGSSGSQRRRSYSANRRPSDEYPDYRLASPRSTRRRAGSTSPGGGSSPRQSLSTSSPKHQPHCVSGSSKTSLLSKPGVISANSSPLRAAGYADCAAGAGGATTALLPRAHQSSSSNSYSKPAMEVAVAALVFGAGVVTLVVALIIGSNAWMIVGAISMAIGGVFIAFGAYFYISRYKPLQATRDNMEIRVVDSKHLAELSQDGFRRRFDMDL